VKRNYGITMGLWDINPRAWDGYIPYPSLAMV